LCLASPSLRHRFAIASPSLRHRFAIASPSLRHRFAIASLSLRSAVAKPDAAYFSAADLGLPRSKRGIKLGDRLIR